ncbi:cytochrome PufQ [Aquamicrobium soli]|uniref:Cytochrome PufQ n=1 Tax=Aquamicrobium soli TaxID=1811518 RepID=A0ABV7K8L0_9HYPH
MSCSRSRNWRASILIAALILGAAISWIVSIVRARSVAEPGPL